jgi:hypothetical protein
MLQVITPPRGNDAYGSGEFGSPRNGSHPTHRGVDLAAAVGSVLISPVKGRVTKHGTVYRDDPSYTYIEITDDDLKRHRFFYVRPLYAVNALVEKGAEIGAVQNISGRYQSTVKSPMVNHIHYEIINDHGQYIDPSCF